MATYLYVEIQRIHDAERYRRYATAAGPILQAHGGTYVFAQEKVTPLSDTPVPRRVVLVRFPDRQALDRCLASPEYSAIAPLREQSTRSRALVIGD